MNCWVSYQLDLSGESTGTGSKEWQFSLKSFKSRAEVYIDEHGKSNDMKPSSTKSKFALYFISFQWKLADLGHFITYKWYLGWTVTHHGCKTNSNYYRSCSTAWLCYRFNVDFLWGFSFCENIYCKYLFRQWVGRIYFKFWLPCPVWTVKADHWVFLAQQKKSGP